jgi:prepilin-type processing-associated H-X9-DG protein
MFHGNVGTFAFADAHVEGHKWFGGGLIAAGVADSNPPLTPPANWQTTGATPLDVNYMVQNYRFPGWNY